MKILLMFFNERCYTYVLKDGYFEPLAIDGRCSRLLSAAEAVFAGVKSLAPDEAGLLYFEERFAPFVEMAEKTLEHTSRLRFSPSAREIMCLPITAEEDELMALGLSAPSGSGSSGGLGSGSGSGSGFGGGYGIELI